MAETNAALFWIQVTEPGASPRVVTLTDPIDVGRDCDGLVLADPTTSRRHLVLEPQAEGVLVVDQGSANGTFVDGERLVEPMLLEPGRTVVLGETELKIVKGRQTNTVAADTAPAEPQHRASSAARDLNRAANKGGMRGLKRS